MNPSYSWTILFSLFFVWFGNWFILSISKSFHIIQPHISQIQISEEEHVAPKSDFEKWRHHTRKTRSAFCRGSEKNCVAGPTLKYRAALSGRHEEVNNEFIFLWMGQTCPNTFVPGRIYSCTRWQQDRPYEGFDNWMNVLNRNKIEQVIAYQDFTDELQDLSAKSDDIRGICNLPSNMDDALDYPLMENFYPETHTFFTPEDYEHCQHFLAEQIKNGAVSNSTLYLLKSNDANQGHGLTIMTVSDLLEWLKVPKKQDFVLQRYIDNPLLWNGKKFTLRTWAIVYNADPLMVTGRMGHINLAFATYDKDLAYSQFANLKPSAKEWTKEDLYNRYHSIGQLIEYLDTLHIFNPSDEQQFTSDNFRDVILYIMDVMRFAVSATYSTSEKYIFPINAPYDWEAVKKTGWGNATVVSYICFDWTITADGKAILTEENHTCGVPAGFGQKNELQSRAHDFLPDWKQEFVYGLQVVPFKMAEEIFYRKRNALPFSFNDLETDFEANIPLIDQNPIVHLSREQRSLCHRRMYDKSVAGKQLEITGNRFKVVNDRWRKKRSGVTRERGILNEFSFVHSIFPKNKGRKS